MLPSHHNLCSMVILFIYCAVFGPILTNGYTCIIRIRMKNAIMKAVVSFGQKTQNLTIHYIRIYMCSKSDLKYQIYMM